MPQSIDFHLPTTRLSTAFDGPHLTSDGGLCWLSEADSALGLCAALAQHVPEWRRRAGRHSLETLVRQRVFQIACGYEDQNDADALRHDPLLKLVCGRLPDEADLASQPTLSRLENAVDRKACYRLAVALVSLYIQERGREGRPERILIDADGTDDPTHGDQEGSAYHGYYGEHTYHPLLLFDGDSDFADRLSDHAFWGNQFRLLLHAAAYWLLDTVRRWLTSAHATRHPSRRVFRRWGSCGAALATYRTSYLVAASAVRSGTGNPRPSATRRPYSSSHCAK